MKLKVILLSLLLVTIFFALFIKCDSELFLHFSLNNLQTHGGSESNSVNSSEKGKWSESDKNKFRQDMNAVEELSNFGENKNKWIECYLSKCEAKYSSYKEANMDPKGTEKLGFDCVRDVITAPQK